MYDYLCGWFKARRALAETKQAIHLIWLEMKSNVDFVPANLSKYKHMDPVTQQELTDIQNALATVPGLVSQITALKAQIADNEAVPADVASAIQALDTTALAIITPATPASIAKLAPKKA